MAVAGGITKEYNRLIFRIFVGFVIYLYICIGFTEYR